MTYPRYSHHYSANSQWEYKIVRARHYEFAHRGHLRALVEQEALAGWELVEKYNDSQVRFRRPRQARQYDIELPPTIDPYRTVYEPNITPESSLQHLIILIVSVIGAIITIAVLGVLLSLPAIIWPMG